MLVIILLLLIGGGVSVTAENAVPGDMLYPVKVKVNEEVRAQLSVSAEAKADWEVKRAERRFEEVEKLATDGRLTAEITAEIEERFNAHVAAFDASATEVSTEGNIAGAAEARSGLETALRVHEEILSHITVTNSQASAAMGAFITNVRAKLSAQAQARAKAEASVFASGGAEVQTAAEGKRKAAENKIAEVEKYIAREKASVSAEVSAEAEARLALAKQAIVRGGGKIDAGSYGEAFVSFQEAMRLAQEAKLIFMTKERLKIEVGTVGIGTVFQAEGGSNSGNRGGNATTSGGVKVEVGAGATGIGAGATGEAGARMNVGL